MRSIVGPLGGGRRGPVPGGLFDCGSPPGSDYWTWSAAAPGRQTASYWEVIAAPPIRGPHQEGAHLGGPGLGISPKVHEVDSAARPRSMARFSPLPNLGQEARQNRTIVAAPKFVLVFCLLRSAQGAAGE